MSKINATSLVLIVALLPAAADIAVTSEARREIGITAYQNGGLIRDTRKLGVPQGTSRIRFEGVASEIDDRSVSLEWAGEAAVDVLEQAYEFDLVSSQKLMEKFLGKEVEIVPTPGMWPDTSVHRAELVSVHGGEPVFRIGTKITYGNIGRVLFPYVPDDLYTRPTLIWRIQSTRRQEATLSVTYAAAGLSWSPDYIVELDASCTSGRLAGRINVSNRSGMDFDQALFTFVEGTIGPSRAAASEDAPGRSLCRSVLGQNALAASAQYIYPVKRPLSIRHNQTKQISWLEPMKVRASLRYLFVCQAVVGERGPPCASTVLVIENLEQGGPGVLAPGARIRAYLRKGGGECRFVGEDTVAGTSASNTATVSLGSDPSVTMTRTISVDRRKTDRGTEYNVEAVLTNAKAGEIRALVRQELDRGTRVLKATEAYTMPDSAIAQFDCGLRPGQTRRLSYTLLRQE